MRCGKNFPLSNRGFQRCGVAVISQIHCRAERKIGASGLQVSVVYEPQPGAGTGHHAGVALPSGTELFLCPGYDATAGKGIPKFSFAALSRGRNPASRVFEARDHCDSIEFPAYGDGIRLDGNKLRVQHVGVIRVKVHRLHQGVVRTVMLSEPCCWHRSRFGTLSYDKQW